MNYIIPIEDDCELVETSVSEHSLASANEISRSVGYIPDDPLYSNQWALQSMSLPQAWTLETGSQTVYVGVIDSGIQGDHPDLENQINVELSKCFYPVGEDPLSDSGGHGTRMAGVIGAEANNLIGIAGVCWNVQLVSLRVGAGDGNMNAAATAEAIRYAELNGIKILNFSAGGYSEYPEIEEAVEEYSGLFICSAGNNGKNIDSSGNYFHPARYDLPNILVVGATQAGGTISSSSNYGQTSVDVFAPGDGIVSTNKDGGYSTTYGTSTSLATAHVSGVAALLLSAYPDMTTEELKESIVKHVEAVYNSDGKNLYDGKCVSKGMVNAYKALLHTLEYSSSGASTHDCVCADCGYAYTEMHLLECESLSAIRHTKTCSLCDYSYTEAHTMTYESTSESQHIGTCTDCGYTAAMGHLLSCEETSSLYTHSVVCEYCDFSYNEAHDWIDMGNNYQCSICEMTSNTIPIIGQSLANYELNYGEMVTIDSNTILCCIDGIYYFVKAETTEEVVDAINDLEVFE